jgi:hypothetical protein
LKRLNDMENSSFWVGAGADKKHGTLSNEEKVNIG